MPCGLLQSALLVAALASGPLPGAAVMSAFAVTSVNVQVAMPPGTLLNEAPRLSPARATLPTPEEEPVAATRAWVP